MKISESWGFAAPADRVWEMLNDEGFQDLKCQNTKPESYSIDIAPHGGRSTITVVRQMSTEGIPENFRGLIGQILEITETQDWGDADADGNRTAQLTVEVKGQPLKMTGTIEATAGADGTDFELRADLRCGLPFVGGKVEKAAAPAVVAAIQAESTAGNEWLAKH